MVSSLCAPATGRDVICSRDACHSRCMPLLLCILPPDASPWRVPARHAQAHGHPEIHDAGQSAARRLLSGDHHCGEEACGPRRNPVRVHCYGSRIGTLLTHTGAVAGWSPIARFRVCFRSMWVSFCFTCGSLVGHPCVPFRWWLRSMRLLSHRQVAHLPISGYSLVF